MIINELEAYSETVLNEIDALMRLLSPESSCSEEKLLAVLNDPNSHLFVAMDGEHIVGCATFCVLHTPEFRLGAVESVVVSEECRGKHVGRQLMDAILEMASGMSPIKIHLTSRPSRFAANKLYQSLGFVMKETNCYEYTI